MQSEERQDPPTIEKFTQDTMPELSDKLMKQVTDLSARWQGPVHVLTVVIPLDRTDDDQQRTAEVFFALDSFGSHPAGLVQVAEALMARALQLGYEPSITKQMGLGEEVYDATRRIQ